MQHIAVAPRARRIFYVVALLAIILSGYSTQAVRRAAAQEISAEPGVIVTLSTVDAKQSFSAAEPVIVHVAISNPGAEAISVLAWSTPINGLEGPLLEVTRDGEPVSYLGKLVKRPAPTAQDFIAIEPGQTLETDVDLSLEYDFSISGEYVIRYALDSLAAPESMKRAGVTSSLLSLTAEGRPPQIFEKVGKIDLQKVTGTTTYTSCSTSQQADLTSARTNASVFLSDAVQYFAAAKQGTRYTTWFGTYDASRYSTVSSHFTNLRSAIDTANPMGFDCSCTDSSYAWVYGWNAYNINLCNAFWTAPMTGTDSKAGTLIHETSHFWVVAWTDDDAYGQANAQNLATTNPSHAIGNADNHEYFAEQMPPLERPRRPACDFDGNGKTDVAVIRPSDKKWYVNDLLTVGWYTAGDIPVPGDYNGDGRTDLAVYRPSDGKWYVKDQSSTPWGIAGDVPVPADYNGDGKTDLAVFRPSDGKWYVKNQFNIAWGTSGDIPVPADYNNDGSAELAVVRPSDHKWYIRNVGTYSWHVAGDVPAPGDYDNDGSSEVAVFRPSDGKWYVKDGANTPWGITGDVPVPGDYNGDGQTDLGIFRPSDGKWYIKDQFNLAYGASGDFACPALWTGQAATTSMYFVLTWGASPSDLDSHLWLPAATPFHVYWANRGSLTAFPWANLDMDDTSSYGPETIRIEQPQAGSYRYAVHNYSNQGTPTSTALGSSGAQVQVYRSGALVRTFVVPSGSGIWWYVFDVNAVTGAITAQNYLSTTAVNPYKIAAETTEK